MYLDEDLLSNACSSANLDYQTIVGINYQIIGGSNENKF